MSSRRAQAENDSLDMLLDTMCNLFGGIILLALMVTLIAKDAEMATSVSEAELRTKELQERKLAKLQEELKAAQTYQQQLASESGDPEVQEQLKVLQQRESIEQTFNELKVELESATQKMEETAKSLEEMEQMKRNQAVSASAVEQQEEARPQRLRLPREHSTTKTPVEVVVKHGEVFPVNFYQRSNPVMNSAGFQRIDGPGGVKVLEPIQGKGMSPKLHMAQLKKFFRSLPSNGYLVFRVYGDSFENFNLAKQAASDAGFELSWMPIEDDVNVVLGGGRTSAPKPL
ncbi:hypothetical protein N9B94_00735 [Verrucomicrobia bacterium]|nr:hypothetical protein [Verrucomicrobiota bacterium]